MSEPHINPEWLKSSHVMLINSEGFPSFEEQLDRDAENQVMGLRKLYKENEEFRALADKIHNSRMLPGAACDGCLALALERFNAGV